MREIADLSVQSLYGKINFIYEQCRAFAADRERRLATMAFERIYLATDRQDYLVKLNASVSLKGRSEYKTF